MSAPANPSRRSLLLAAVSSLPLAACGFHLRGVRELPFETVFIERGRASQDLMAEIRRAIERQSATRVTDDPKSADAIVDITENKVEKVILSLNSAGRVREYQLRQRFSFRVRDRDNVEIAPISTIELRRDLTYNDAEMLAKQQEEQVLYTEMQSDLIQQLLRRLQAVKRNPA